MEQELRVRVLGGTELTLDARHELGRRLAVGERATLGLDRAGHLERARSTFETLGCQADLAGIGRVERETGVENRAH